MNLKNLDNDALAALSRETMQRLLKKRRDQQFHYFVPTGLGEEFIRVVGGGKYFVVLLSAANGIGKTELGLNVLAHFLYPSKSAESKKYFDLPLFNNFPYPKKARIISEPTTVESTIVPGLKRVFPKNHYDHRKGRKMYDAYWNTDTGWELDIMTYEQDVKEFESSTLGLAWFDEPPPKRIFKATVARMRKGGIIFITATPLQGSAWMYDELIAKPEDDIKKHGFTTYLEADVETACVQHGIRGFLEHENIEKMISQYDEEDMQARVKGKFHHLIGLVFKMFNRAIHIIRPFEINHEDWVVGHALDPHPRNPDASMWLAVNRKGTKVVCDELFMKGTVSEAAERIKKKNANYRIIKKIIDPSAFNEDQHQETGLTLAQRLEGKDLIYERATKDRVNADRAIADALNYQKIGQEMVRAPQLYIFDSCLRTIWELEHYRWQDWTGKASERKDPMEKPVDKDDHMIEDLGRLLVQDLKWTPMPPKAKKNWGASTLPNSPYLGRK